MVQCVKGFAAWEPEFDTQNPHSGRRELTPARCPLSSIYIVMCLVCVCVCKTLNINFWPPCTPTDMYTHTCRHTQRFLARRNSICKASGVGWISCPIYREEKKLGCELDRCLVSQGIVVHITLDFLEWWQRKLKILNSDWRSSLEKRKRT